MEIGFERKACVSVQVFLRPGTWRCPGNAVGMTQVMQSPTPKGDSLTEVQGPATYRQWRQTLKNEQSNYNPGETANDGKYKSVHGSKCTSLNSGSPPGTTLGSLGCFWKTLPPTLRAG